LPRATMALARYEAALANTQQDWQRVDSLKGSIENGMDIWFVGGMWC
jgi:hypothetical protein